MNKVCKLVITHTRRGTGEKIALNEGEKVFFTEHLYKEDKVCGVPRKLFVLKPKTENELIFISLVKFQKGKKRYYFVINKVKHFFESFDPFKAVLPPEKKRVVHIKKKPAKK